MKVLEGRCLMNIRHAKAMGMEFGEWLVTPWGEIGQELTQNDIAALHAIYEDCVPERVH
jgi:hypothetical protein